MPVPEKPGIVSERGVAAQSEPLNHAIDTLAVDTVFVETIAIRSRAVFLRHAAAIIALRAAVT